MRKSKHILIIFMLLSIFNISKVNALQGYTKGFAEEIGPIKSGACYGCSWGYGVNWKTAKYNGSSKAVFCSKLKLTGVASRKCVLEKGDKQWDRPTQAGVADIIMNYYRYYKNDSNYMKINYYTTYAINFFLYRKDKDPNHLPVFSTQKDNNNQNDFLGTEKILNDAEKAYKKVNDKFEISLNKSKITYTKIDNEYYSDWITVSEPYLDSSNIKNATVKINNNSYTCRKSSDESDKCKIVENGANKYRIKIFSNAFASVAEGSTATVSTTVTFKGKKTYYVAAEYDCANYALGYQKMVPNEVIKVIETSEKTLTGSFEHKKEIIDTELSCQEELTTIKSIKSDNLVNYRKNLYNLYNKYKNVNKDYSQLLDVNNPSCTSIENTIDKSCGNTNVVKKWIDTSLSDNYLYCTASYSLNSPFFLMSTSQPNNLLYQSPNGNVASANVSISCNAVTNTNIGSNFDFNVKLPKIMLSAFGGNDKTDNIVFESNFINNSSKCTLKENNIYTCSSVKDITTSQIGFNINGIVTYKYPEDNNLGIKKGKLNNNSVVTNANINCRENCLKLGYGIYVPSNVYNDDDSTIYFDLSGTPFAVKNSETKEYVYEQKCPYQINNIKEKNEVLYRNISTTSPFLSLTGSERYTGSNWCNFETDEKEANEESIEVEQTTPSCFYPGDVNKNGTWDDEDYTLLKEAIGNKEGYSYLYDANGDKTVDYDDLTNINNFIENSDYPKYDINLDGVFDRNDLALIIRVSLGDDTITGFQMKQADINNDCKITLVDPTALERELNNLEEDLNIESEEIKDESNTDDDPQEEVVPDTMDVPINLQDTSWISFGNNYDPEFSCNANNTVVRKYIKNRPNANGDIKITTNGTTETKKTKPLYSFTLTPDNIKKIREYNATTTYDDFNLTCNNGKECISDFVNDIFLYNYYATFNKDNSLCSSDKFCNISEIIDSEVNK